jgi:hypothetical protein
MHKRRMKGYKALGYEVEEHPSAGGVDNKFPGMD